MPSQLVGPSLDIIYYDYMAHLWARTTFLRVGNIFNIIGPITGKTLPDSSMPHIFTDTWLFKLINSLLYILLFRLIIRVTLYVNKCFLF